MTKQGFPLYSVGVFAVKFLIHRAEIKGSDTFFILFLPEQKL